MNDPRESAPMESPLGGARETPLRALETAVVPTQDILAYCTTGVPLFTTSSPYRLYDEDGMETGQQVGPVCGHVAVDWLTPVTGKANFATLRTDVGVPVNWGTNPLFWLANPDGTYWLEQSRRATVTMQWTDHLEMPFPPLFAGFRRCPHYIDQFYGDTGLRNLFGPGYLNGQSIEGQPTFCVDLVNSLNARSMTLTRVWFSATGLTPEDAEAAGARMYFKDDHAAPADALYLSQGVLTYDVKIISGLCLIPSDDPVIMPFTDGTSRTVKGVSLSILDHNLRGCVAIHALNMDGTLAPAAADLVFTLPTWSQAAGAKEYPVNSERHGWPAAQNFMARGDYALVFWLGLAPADLPGENFDPAVKSLYVIKD